MKGFKNETINESIAMAGHNEGKNQEDKCGICYFAGSLARK